MGNRILRSDARGECSCRCCHSATRKGSVKLVAGTCEPAAQRSGRPAEFSCRLVECQPFEVAQHDRHLKRRGQATGSHRAAFRAVGAERRLFWRMDHRLDSGVRAGDGMPHYHAHFPLAIAHQPESRPARRAHGNPEEPVSQEIRIADGIGFASQHHEYRPGMRPQGQAGRRPRSA